MVRERICDHCEVTIYENEKRAIWGKQIVCEECYVELYNRHMEKCTVVEEWIVIEIQKSERGSEVSYFDTLEEAEKYAEKRKERYYVEAVDIGKIIRNIK